MAIEPAEFRRVLGHLPTGVTVVATRSPEGPVGLTANAVTAVSLAPPLILVCIDRSSATHDPLLSAASFSVNVLDGGQERLARRFSETEGGDKFVGIAHRSVTTGAPVLEDALAWLDCSVWARYPGGDHTIVVGEVLSADARDGAPLVFYRGGYGRFAP